MAATLTFVEGLAKIGSEHSLEVFKTIFVAYTGQKVNGDSEETDTDDTDDTESPDGEETGGLDATTMMA